METSKDYSAKMKLKSIGSIVLVILVFFAMLIAAEVIVLIFVGIYYIAKGNDVQSIIQKMLSFANSKSFEIQGPLSILQNLVTILSVVIFLKGSLKDRFDKLKLTVNQNSGKLFSAGVVSAVSAVIVITIAGMLTGMTKFQSIGINSFPEAIKILLLSLGTFLSVGFGEEIMFRGYALDKLSQSGGKYWTILVSAFIFMLMHIGTYSHVFDFIDVFSAGVLLGLMFYKFKSLWLSVGFHFMWDFAQSFIVRLENQPIGTKAIFNFSVPQDIYVFGINLGCRFEIIFIIVVLILIMIVKRLKGTVNNF